MCVVFVFIFLFIYILCNRCELHVLNTLFNVIKMLQYILEAGLNENGKIAITQVFC